MSRSVPAGRGEHPLGDVGRLVVRVGVGGLLFVHGTQKLFGWFSGQGLRTTARFLHEVGYRPGAAAAVGAGVGEALGRAGLAVGLATPATGAMAAGASAVAADLHAPNGLFNTDGGLELPAVLSVVAAGTALAGPGALSLDRALGGALDRPWMRVVAVTGAAVAVTAVVLLRRRELRREGSSAKRAATGRAASDPDFRPTGSPHPRIDEAQPTEAHPHLR